jgi:hypothetical protein
MKEWWELMEENAALRAAARTLLSKVHELSLRPHPDKDPGTIRSSQDGKRKYIVAKDGSWRRLN